MNYKPKFKIGDLVKVVDTGRMYSQYDLAANRMKLKNWDNTAQPSRGGIAEVVGVIPHPAEHRENGRYGTIITILGIRLKNGREVVIGQDGCVMHQKFCPKLFDEDLFVI